MLKRKWMNTHTHIGLYKFFQCGYVHVHLCHCVCVCACGMGANVRMQLVCRHFCGRVCIEGAVNSPACVSAVFSVLLSVTTAKWLDKNQTDLSHSCICIQEDNGWMLASAGWGHHLVAREQEKEDKEGKLKADRDGVKKKTTRDEEIRVPTRWQYSVVCVCVCARTWCEPRMEKDKFGRDKTLGQHT